MGAVVGGRGNPGDARAAAVFALPVADNGPDFGGDGMGVVRRPPGQR